MRPRPSASTSRRRSVDWPQPLDSIYLVATSAMDLFRQLDAIDTITLAGLDAGGWYIEEAREALERVKKSGRRWWQRK